MAEEAWQSITVIENKRGEPHVLQQKLEVHENSRGTTTTGYTRPTPKHRLVPVKNLVSL